MLVLLWTALHICDLQWDYQHPVLLFRSVVMFICVELNISSCMFIQ
jgi:hypothetical protein